MQIENPPCDLCGSTQGTVLVQDTSSEQTFAYIKCSGCGLIRLSPRPAVQAMSKYYPQNYAPHQCKLGPTGKSTTIQQRLLEHYLIKKYHLVTRWKLGGYILDVGCSNGNFLAIMKQKGWRTAGVEFIPDVAEWGKQHYGLDIWVGDFLSIPADKNLFDVITMWDVLEHLHSPTRALQKCRDLLVPGGILIVTLPHWESLDRIIFGRYWSGFDFPRHLYVFPRPVLRQMVYQSGLHWISSKCVIGSYGAWRLSLKRFLNDRFAFINPTIYDGLALRLISKPYFLFTEFTNIGTEVTVVCRKPSKENNDVAI